MWVPTVLDAAMHRQMTLLTGCVVVEEWIGAQSVKRLSSHKVSLVLHWLGCNPLDTCSRKWGNTINARMTGNRHEEEAELGHHYILGRLLVRKRSYVLVSLTSSMSCPFSLRTASTDHDMINCRIIILYPSPTLCWHTPPSFPEDSGVSVGLRSGNLQGLWLAVLQSTSTWKNKLSCPSGVKYRCNIPPFQQNPNKLKMSFLPDGYQRDHIERRKKTRKVGWDQGEKTIAIQHSGTWLVLYTFYRLYSIFIISIQIWARLRCLLTVFVFVCFLNLACVIHSSIEQ